MAHGAGVPHRGCAVPEGHSPGGGHAPGAGGEVPGYHVAAGGIAVEPNRRASLPGFRCPLLRDALMRFSPACSVPAFRRTRR
jgi:hypothetical protein